jgi:transcriptional regulator with XRE-family HTH domain
LNRRPPKLATKLRVTFSRFWDIFSHMELVQEDVDLRLASRLKALRRERGWSLDELASRSGVSRATLSRLENAEVSATASVLGRLCAAFGLTLSRLMYLVEESFTARLAAEAQPVWHDQNRGFLRRSVSPPAQGLAGEVVQCNLAAGVRIDYERPPRPGLEHHLVMIEGQLRVTADGEAHELRPGDCLRYKLSGASRFETPPQAGARYFLFMV